ncbi:hypothetical protein [Phocaeicola vulgatus]|nr:hypothetical protein [Phocaeicola vulgatus]
MVPLYQAFTNEWFGKENTTLSAVTFTPDVTIAADPRLLTN